MITKNTFGKANRLQTPAEFKAVFSQSIRSRSVYFTILARPTGTAVARLGVIVSKRLIRQAVRRHQIRRLVRESFRLHQSLLRGLDVIVLARCTIPKLPNQVLFDCLLKQWHTLRIEWLKEPSR